MNDNHIAVSDPRALKEALKMAAIAITGLYEQLERKPPDEARALLKKLEKFAAEISN